MFDHQVRGVRIRIGKVEQASRQSATKKDGASALMYTEQNWWFVSETEI
jgi:hypothetical protein